jgi:hypothetical protein
VAHEATSAPVKRPEAMTVVHDAQCITPRATSREYQEIKKLMEQFCEKQQQQCQEGVPSHQRESKQKVDPEEEMEFYNAKRALKAVYDHSKSESSDNEHHKTLHIMFGGSWDIMSWRIVKTLCREVVAAAPVPRAAPHFKWMETLISFDASDCPKSMVSAGQLLLLVSPTIANIKLYHILIDGGATLNLTAFKKL